LFSQNTNAQKLKSWGLKLGPSLSGFFSESSGGSLDFIGYELGFFIDLSFSKKVSMPIELLYSVKGNKETAVIISPDSSSADLLSNVFHFVSLRPNVKFYFSTKSTAVIYALVGLRGDVLVYNKRSGTDNNKKLKIPRFEFGASLGMGIEFHNKFMLEIQYQPNITILYSGYGDYAGKKRLFSLNFLFGFRL
jgi:hypothetical protein